jgi:hypothetical protein
MTCLECRAELAPITPKPIASKAACNSLIKTSINPFVGQVAVSRARSFLVYQCDMPRHSLRGSLRFIPKNKFLEVST